MINASIIAELCLISGHLKGVADGLMFHETDTNKKSLSACSEMLRNDSEHIMDIVSKISFII